MSFNPRAREGRDLRANMMGWGVKNVSIHAPARGATDASYEDAERILFQSTRPRGARRPVKVSHWHETNRFQSTRPRGARHGFVSLSLLRKCFNPRAREGRDQVERAYLGADGVSIHAPARGATMCA